VAVSVTGDGVGVEGGVVDHVGQVVGHEGGVLRGEVPLAGVGGGDRVGDGVADLGHLGGVRDLVDLQARQWQVGAVARKAGGRVHPVDALGRRLGDAVGVVVLADDLESGVVDVQVALAGQLDAVGDGDAVA